MRGLVILSLCIALYSISGCAEAQPEIPVTTTNTTQVSDINGTAQPGKPEGLSPAFTPPLISGPNIAGNDPGVESYAKFHNMTLEEAARRTNLQILIGQLDAWLTEYEKATFAGLWIEHSPDFRVVIVFTDRGNETIKRHLPPELKDIVEVRGAETSLAELRSIQENTGKDLEKLSIDSQSQVDVFQNRVIFFVVDRERFDTAIRDGGLVLSPKVDVVTVKTLGRWD